MQIINYVAGFEKRGRRRPHHRHRHLKNRTVYVCRFVSAWIQAEDYSHCRLHCHLHHRCHLQ